LVRASQLWVFGVLIALVLPLASRADTLDGVLTGYESGNKGTDIFVRTNDGRNHDLWFDNLKKPLFQGHELPWCPEFPCTGWPSQLVIGKTRVRVFIVQEHVSGRVIKAPARIDLLH
jgi:hypothetical protein